jgi:hypothetical protein
MHSVLEASLPVSEQEGLERHDADRMPSPHEGRRDDARFSVVLSGLGAEQGVSREVAERCLAHAVRSKVEAAYHRTDQLEQRRPVMEAWAAFIAGGSPDGT